MKIEKIELSGFKSFAEKTAIHLHPGVTGIVGPNGCGKSNIVDAIKWLLGEQSPKALRGNKMDELVFNGSQTRKPKGMAEVSLYISGIVSSREDNGHPDGITVITRRIYRSGDSEYAINNTPCRLKDIRELLLDTGLDVKNYFIFEQERISQLINAKPEERRFLIEEIAGVIKYKVKKAEALQKLEHSKINLQRINDILNEVRRQLNSLERQVKRAEKFKKLSEERRKIELALARIQFAQLKANLERILGDLNQLREEEASKKARLSSIDNMIQQGRILLIEREKALSALYYELEEKERLVSQNEKIIIQDELNAESCMKEIERLTLQREDNLRIMDEVRERIKNLGRERDSLHSEIERVKQEMNELALQLADSERVIINMEQELEERRKSVLRLSDELSLLTNDRSRLHATLESLQRRGSALQNELEELQIKIKELDLKIAQITEEIKFCSEELMSLKDRRDEISSEMETVKHNLELKRHELQDLKEKLASNISRLESLKELVLNETTANLLRDAQSLNVIGFLSDFIEVPERYERAIEAVLAEEINTFIVSDIEDLKRAIKVIKEQGTSMASFFSPELGISSSSDKAGYESAPGGCVKAMDIVRILDNRFLGIIESLLGMTIIADSFEEALRIKNKGYRSCIATLDGDVINQHGIVRSGRGGDVLRRKREIKELEASIETLKGVIDKKTGEFQGLKEQLSSTEAELQKIEGLIDREEARLTGLRHNLDIARQEEERLEKRISYINLEKEEITKERTSILTELSNKDMEISGLEEKRREFETGLERQKNELGVARQRTDSLRQKYTALQLEHTRIVENYNSILREIDTSEKMLLAYENKNGEILNSIEGLQNQRDNLLKKITDLRAQTSEILRDVVLLRDKVNMERQEIEQENQKFLEMEEGLKTIRSEIEELLAKIRELDIQRAETVVRLDGIRENILINYGIKLDELLEQEKAVSPENQEVSSDGETGFSSDDDTSLRELSVEELSERLNLIRKKIEDLGPVNLGTLEEYEELKERHRFLSSQQEDLTKSIAELEEAIHKINATTRQRLREAFDALNEKFGEVFIRLFGGGRASIVLTDEKNILDSGIEIIAQPPGKKLQNINLLSGGEKALTALSLLIASFLIKPAPLCILDEADAPLDDSNIERFAQMIRELSKNIQFIIITHNRITMSHCDYLYGVTMEEPGISKIISLQLSSV